ncbi:siderophore ABC transporter substrate-binding protein [Myroides sp. LJL119]
MNKFLITCTAACLAVFASCKDTKTTNQDDSVNQIVVKHLSGESSVNQNPKNAVVLNYGSLDSFEELDIPVKGLPKGNLPSYLQDYQQDKSIVDVGTLKDPNFEKINELDPELIIISGRQAPLYDELSKIAPTINLELDENNYINSFKENQRIIAKLYGKEQEVEQELNQIDQRIANINALTQNSDKTGLIVLVNEGRYSVYGKGSRFGIIHDVFGIKPADDKIQAASHGQAVSNEFIKEVNPDYLFVIDRGAAIKRQSLDKEEFANDLIKQTNAYKNDNIVFLDSEVWYLSGGGLKSIKMMIDEIENAIQDKQ